MRSYRLIEGMDDLHAQTCSTQAALLRLIAVADDADAWIGSGARDMAHFVSMRYGVSWWKAERWVKAAHALEVLPRLSDAFEGGKLGIDKVVELCRFATPETEARLIRWAGGVSCGAIRHRGDVEARRSRAEAEQVIQDRRLSWWYFDEGRRLGLEAELPAAEGAIVVRAIERLAAQIPRMPDEDDRFFAPARRADALVAICAGRAGSNTEPDRATVIVHAQAEGLANGTAGCELEGGPAIHPETVKRLLCNARVQMVEEDEAGGVRGLGRTSRVPSAWMVREVRYRDRECRFPGCGARRFAEAHHVVWWRHGGRTDLDNLVLICWFHHRLVHEYGWSVRRQADGTVEWFHPDGARYCTGRSPVEHERMVLAAAS